ncbi:MAG: putative transcriptional regulator [Saprospiraceae bacterium]|jgi:predicted transcriptional regulator|tara:strand:- start:1287 stop:1739 length:453 start_codon:yes stop_codon:yes gene_type:complete
MKNFQNKLVEKDNKQAANQTPSVEEYMTRDLITFKEDTDINVVIKSLLDNRISGAPVLNDAGQVIGLIDDKDCLNVLFGNVYNQLPTTQNTVSRYMSNVMKSISVNQNILDVASVFISSPFKRLLVMDENNKLVGQISRRDILRAIIELT